MSGVHVDQALDAQDTERWALQLAALAHTDAPTFLTQFAWDWLPRCLHSFDVAPTSWTVAVWDAADAAARGYMDDQSRVAVVCPEDLLPGEPYW